MKKQVTIDTTDDVVPLNYLSWDDTSVILGISREDDLVVMLVKNSNGDDILAIDLNERAIVRCDGQSKFHEMEDDSIHSALREKIKQLNREWAITIDWYVYDDFKSAMEDIAGVHVH